MRAIVARLRPTKFWLLNPKSYRLRMCLFGDWMTRIKTLTSTLCDINPTSKTLARQLIVCTNHRSAPSSQLFLILLIRIAVQTIRQTTSVRRKSIVSIRPSDCRILIGTDHFSIFVYLSSLFKWLNSLRPCDWVPFCHTARMKLPIHRVICKAWTRKSHINIIPKQKITSTRQALGILYFVSPKWYNYVSLSAGVVQRLVCKFSKLEIGVRFSAPAPV